MKALIHLLTFSLLGGHSLSHVHAQNTYYGIYAGKGGVHSTHIGASAGRVSIGITNAFLGAAAHKMVLSR